MARSVEQLAAWSILLAQARAGDNSLPADMQAAIVEVENELTRLCQVEAAAIYLTQMLVRAQRAKDDEEQWERLMDFYWSVHDRVCDKIVALVPEAFTEAALQQDSGNPQEIDVSIALIQEALRRGK
jgi:hypothetical protein